MRNLLSSQKVSFYQSVTTKLRVSKHTPEVTRRICGLTESRKTLFLAAMRGKTIATYTGGSNLYVCGKVCSRSYLSDLLCHGVSITGYDFQKLVKTSFELPSQETRLEHQTPLLPACTHM